MCGRNKAGNVRRYSDYRAYINGNPVGCMAMIDYDPNTWKDIQKGESLFIHRLAVKRVAAGQGVSKALIDYAKTQAIQRDIDAVRLDCRQKMISSNNTLLQMMMTNI